MTGQDVYSQFKSALLALHVPAAQADAAAKQSVAVAMAESTFNANAIAKTNSENSVGLFQVNMLAQGKLLTKLTGSTSMDSWKAWLQVPENNIQAAAAIYHNWSNTFNAWTTYTKKTPSYTTNLKLVQNGTAWQQWPVANDTAKVASNDPSSVTSFLAPLTDEGSPKAQITGSGDTPAWVTRVMYVVIGLAAAALGLFILIKTLAVPAIGNITSALKGA
jgi:hypothetical protein